MISDLPFYRYVWDVAKNTTRAERLSCAAAISILIVCIILIVYFTVIAKKVDQVADAGESLICHLTYTFQLKVK